MGPFVSNSGGAACAFISPGMVGGSVVGGCTERARETLLQPGNGILESQEAKWGEKPSPRARFRVACTKPDNLTSPGFVGRCFQMAHAARKCPSTATRSLRNFCSNNFHEACRRRRYMRRYANAIHTLHICILRLSTLLTLILRHISRSSS